MGEWNLHIHVAILVADLINRLQSPFPLVYWLGWPPNTVCSQNWAVRCCTWNEISALSILTRGLGICSRFIQSSTIYIVYCEANKKSMSKWTWQCQIIRAVKKNDVIETWKMRTWHFSNGARHSKQRDSGTKSLQGVCPGHISCLVLVHTSFIVLVECELCSALPMTPLASLCVAWWDWCWN